MAARRRRKAAGMSAEHGEFLILWTSGDREVALNMGFMYGLNAKLHDWWSEVTLLIWGPSGNLLLADDELQHELARMQEAGVRPMACKACADRYGIGSRLADLGVEVVYTGEFLTDWIKAAKPMLTI
jgi:hypothetical protein